MPTFEYVHNEDSEIEVKEGDDGRYVERGRLGRGAWMSFGVFIAMITAWFIIQYDGSEGWLLTTSRRRSSAHSHSVASSPKASSATAAPTSSKKTARTTSR